MLGHSTVSQQLFKLISFLFSLEHFGIGSFYFWFWRCLSGDSYLQDVGSSTQISAYKLGPLYTPNFLEVQVG